MRAATVIILAVGFALLSLSNVTGTPLDQSVDVQLRVHTDFAGELGFAPGEPDPLVGTAQCTVAVPGGSDAGDVLDQAVADGCILEWDYDEFDGVRFVSSVDGLRAVAETCIAWPHACQWWEFMVDGSSAGYGIDGYDAADGDLVEFFYHTA